MKFLFSFFIFIATASQCANAKTLYIYSWYDYIPASVIQKFEKEKGVKVVLDYFDDNASLEALLLTKSSGYDIVFPTVWPFMQRQIQKGLYQKIDHTRLRNWHHLDKQILTVLEKADPGLEYSAPYVWGLTGIAYNKKMIAELLPNVTLDSWAVIFEPENAARLKDCGLYLSHSINDVFTSALVYMGRNPNSTAPEDMNDAYELLKTVRPYVQRFEGTKVLGSLANGQACASLTWSGDVSLSRRLAKDANNGIEIGYIVPKEGTSFWIDAMAIPIDAPHPDLAHEFIDFIYRPDISAEIVTELQYPVPSSTAYDLISDELKNDPVVNPSKDLLKTAYVIEAKPLEYMRALKRLAMKLIMRRE